MQLQFIRHSEVYWLQLVLTQYPDSKLVLIISHITKHETGKNVFAERQDVCRQGRAPDLRLVRAKERQQSAIQMRIEISPHAGRHCRRKIRGELQQSEWETIVNWNPKIQLHIFIDIRIKTISLFVVLKYAS